MTEVNILAMAFVELSDSGRYKTLWYSLSNNPLTIIDNYPYTLSDSFKILIHYRPPGTHTIPRDGGGRKRVTNLQFTQVKGTAQQREAIAVTDCNTRANVTCYN